MIVNPKALAAISFDRQARSLSDALEMSRQLRDGKVL